MSVKDVCKALFDRDKESSSPVSSTNHWLRLSDEIVLLVFNQLSIKDLVTVSLVNKRFRDLSRDDSLWTELTLDYKDFQYRQDANRCGQLVDRCKKLSSLKITNDSNITSTLDIMTVVVMARETLKSLDIDSSIYNWTKDALALLGYMSELTNLSFALDISSFLGLEEIWKNWKLAQLEVLKFHVEYVDFFEDIELTKHIFQQLRKLKVVQLSHANDAVVIALATNNPDLSRLSIHDYCVLTDQGIIALADSCPDLEELRLNEYLTMCALNHLSSSCKKIKYLQFEEIIGEDEDDTDESNLTNLIGKFVFLEHLSLKWCHEVSDSAVEKIVGTARTLKRLQINVAPKVTESLLQKLRMENPELDLNINWWRAEADHQM